MSDSIIVTNVANCTVEMSWSDRWVSVTVYHVRETMRDPRRKHIDLRIYRAGAEYVELRATRERVRGWVWRVVSGGTWTSPAKADSLVGSADGALARAFLLDLTRAGQERAS